VAIREEVRKIPRAAVALVVAVKKTKMGASELVVASCKNSRLSARLFLDPGFGGVYSEFSSPVSAYRFTARVSRSKSTHKS